MSSPIDNTESFPITQVAQNKSMTWEEMRKIFPSLPESFPLPTRTVQCSKMSYTDGEGVKKNIWMPKGTADTACKHLEKEDWDALAKFPVWNHQKYEDEGEAEERERKAWEWLATDKPEKQKSA